MLPFGPHLPFEKTTLHELQVGGARRPSLDDGSNIICRRPNVKIHANNPCAKFRGSRKLRWPLFEIAVDFIKLVSSSKGII
jgi:hypothetical protein